MVKSYLVSGLLLVMTAMAVTPVSAIAAEREFHSTYALSEGQRVSVKNVNGSVTIRVGGGSSVDVFARIKSNKGQSVVDRVSIDVSTSPDLVIETKYSCCNGEKDTFFKRLFDWDFHDTKASVEYTITVPEYAQLARISTTNGSVQTEGTHGDAVFSSTNGNVHANHLSGRVEARTTNGNIELSGDAEFTRGRTTNGSVRVELPDSISSDVELSSTNGSVTVTMPISTNALVDLSTTNGGIDATGFTMTLESSSRHHIVGRIGSGGPTVRAWTTNGGVRLVKK